MLRIYTRIRLVTALGLIGLAACGDGSGGDPGFDESIPPSGVEPSGQVGKSRSGLTPLAAGELGGTAGTNPGGTGGTTVVGGDINAGGSGSGGTAAEGGGGGTNAGGMGGGAQAGGAGGSSPTTPLPPKPDTEETPANVTVMAKVIKTKLLIADIIYTKQIKLGVARIGEMTESKQDKRYELASGSPDINQPTVRATVVYAEDIEADEVQAKQLFAQQIQYR